jgi:hypothetical protein
MQVGGQSAAVLTLCALLALGSPLHGQVRPSVTVTYEELLREAKRVSGRAPQSAVTGLTANVGKCGLLLQFELDKRWSSFTDKQRSALRAALAAPLTETSRIIGHFEIFYDTSSSNQNTPALLQVDGTGSYQRIPGTAEAFVDSVGRFFNESWAREIDSLGYTAPPLGPGGYYEITITEFGFSGIYGQTIHDTPPVNGGFPPRYVTHISIDNDFRDVYAPSRGMPGLKVTAAHEFHHAIQLGSYGEWVNDFYFYEITSTWMEDVVYNDVNDYYQYLLTPSRPGFPSLPLGQFATPDVSFNAYAGLLPYSRAIWGKFLEQRYSAAIMRRTWENMRGVASLPALDQACGAFGSSLRKEFLEWTLWNAHTGPAADTVQFYAEGRHYPPMHTAPQVTYAGASRSLADSIEALSSSYHPVCLLSAGSALCDTSPKLLAIVSNLNVASSGDRILYQFVYDISGSGGAGYKQLSNGLFVRLSVSDPGNWSSQEIEIAPDSTSILIPRLVAEASVFPNPYRSNGGLLNFAIPYDSSSGALAILNIFSASMDQVWSSEETPHSSSLGYCLHWKGLDQRGNAVPSGTYLFVITVDDRQYVGKFAVIRN